MLNFFIKLEKLYSEYEKTKLLKTRINLLIEIKFLEEKIFYNNKYSDIIEHILKNYSNKTEFICMRYLFFLSNIEIPDKYEELTISCYLKTILKYKFEKNRKEAVHFSIKGLQKFNFRNIEEFVFSISKYSVFSLYKREFIILLGKTSGTIKSINFLIEQMKKYPEEIETIYWSIGMIASYKHYPMVKRKLLNDYLKRRVRDLKKMKKSSMLYFSLIEIFLIPNGIDGKISNDILELLQKNLNTDSLKIILMKVINNNDLSLEEKNIILNIERKYN